MPSLATERLIALAKRLYPWRSAIIMLAILAASLCVVSVVFKLPALMSFQVPFILLMAWCLLVYFFISSFALLNNQSVSKKNLWQRLKHRLANFFTKLLLILCIILTLVTGYLSVRMITVWLS